MKRFLYLIPLLVLLTVGGFSIMQLNRVGSGQAVHVLPSVLINRAVPEFELAATQGRDRGCGTTDLCGQVARANIFGSRVWLC